MITPFKPYEIKQSQIPTKHIDINQRTRNEKFLRKLKKIEVEISKIDSSKDIKSIEYRLKKLENFQKIIEKFEKEYLVVHETDGKDQQNYVNEQNERLDSLNQNIRNIRRRIQSYNKILKFLDKNSSLFKKTESMIFIDFPNTP